MYETKMNSLIVYQLCKWLTLNEPFKALKTTIAVLDAAEHRPVHTASLLMPRMHPPCAGQSHLLHLRSASTTIGITVARGHGKWLGGPENVLYC